MTNKKPKKTASPRVPLPERPLLSAGIVAGIVIAITISSAVAIAPRIQSLQTAENAVAVQAILAQLYVVAAVSALVFAALLYALSRSTAGLRTGNKEGRENFRATLETAAIPIWISRGANIVYMNVAGLRMFGASSPDEVIGRPILSLYDKRGHAGVESRIAAAQRGEQGSLGAERLVRADGTGFDAEVVRSHISVDGESAVIAFANDISERVRALALQERLAAIVASSDDAIIAKSLDGTITDWNLGAERVYGYTEKEIVGKPISTIAPEDKKEEVATILRRLASGDRIEHFETKRRTKDGRTIDVSLTISPIRDKAGTIVGASAIERDVTERKRIEADLATYREHLEELVEKRTAQLEAVNKELEAFAYTASHDLQAPLRTVDGFVQAFLDDHPSVDAKGRDQLDRVRNASRRMSSLINELLEFSRLSKREIHGAEVDLSALATSVVDELRRADPARDVTVTIAPGLKAHGDEPMLRLVLVNLIGNAWKFTGKTPHATIEFGETPRERGKAFFVRDNGAGFDSAYINKLFVPFQRLHLQEEFPGTGIGLATVRRIINRHGGSVWAEGAPGKGATFSFTLS